MEKFKRLMRRAIGNDLDNIEFIEDNILIISDKDAAERIERNVSRLSVVDYAYYNPKRNGIVFSLKK